MDKIIAEKAQNELTMILLYLSRFTEGSRFSDGKDFYAWKGYDFDVLNSLDDEDYIRQGDRPSRTHASDRVCRRSSDLYSRSAGSVP